MTAISRELPHKTLKKLIAEGGDLLMRQRPVIVKLPHVLPKVSLHIFKDQYEAL